tara:strand:+ start:1036 stop:1365 length:330 start_codon:yes stop_codon:yes gene_type:complete
MINLNIMIQEKIVKLIKSNMLLELEQKNKLLAVIDKASLDDIKALELILNSSSQRLKESLNNHLNSDNIDGFLFKLKKIKTKINSFEEKNLEEKETFLEEELLSKIENL